MTRPNSNRSGIEVLARFSQTDTYRTLKDFWWDERERLIQKGITEKDANLFKAIAGFDAAATIIERAVTQINEKKSLENELDDE